MSDKKIIIDFAEDGSLDMEGHGFSGTDCDKAMKAIEDALGVQTARRNKAEYSKAAGQRQTVRQ